MNVIQRARDMEPLYPESASFWKELYLQCGQDMARPTITVSLWVARRPIGDAVRFGGKAKDGVEGLLLAVTKQRGLSGCRIDLVCARVPLMLLASRKLREERLYMMPVGNDPVIDDVGNE